MRRTTDNTLFAIGIGLVMLVTMQVASVQAESKKIWFEDIKDPLSLSNSEKQALAQFVASSIFLAKGAEKNIPAALKADALPRIVFLSISDATTPAQVILASGNGIGEAIEQAVSGVRPLFQQDYKPKWVKLDIVQDVHSISNFDFSKPLEREGSLYGVAFDAQSGIAFLPEELTARKLFSNKQILLQRKIAKYLGQRSGYREQFQRLENRSSLTIYQFSTISFFSDGKAIIPLYRGHRFFNNTSKDELLSSARLAGRYLIRAVDSDGKFLYSYRPATDDMPGKYNILRHAGTVYSMLELYEITHDEELLVAAERAIKYLLKSAKPCQIKKKAASCIVEEGYVKLGGNALTAIALAKYISVTENKKYVPILLRLGKWLLAAQKGDGEFLHKQTYPGGKEVDFVSEYYPAEALLALLRIYELNRDKSWLDTAEKGADYLINVRDRRLSLSELSHDHWLLYALNELYRQRPKRLYLDHALKISNSIIQSQNRTPRYPDWLGSYYDPPRSTPTATRTEGLCASYRLMRDFGDQRDAQRILEAARLGLFFQLQTQFLAETVMYLDDPQRASGGFRRSLTNFEIRIDYVQHNISSLLCLYQVVPVWSMTEVMRFPFHEMVNPLP